MTAGVIEAGAHDFVIVGAGTAGCVLANRLSENSTLTTALLEAGGSATDWRIRMPSAIAVVLDKPSLVWAYKTLPEPFIGGRVIDHPRGRVLGGCSSINGMMHVRGNARDFDLWRDQGCTGWAYQDILHCFRNSEAFEGGADAYRGDSGPLRVTRGLMTEPLHEAFIDSGVQAGYPATADFNGASQEGFGRMDRAIYAGERCSASKAFLEPVVARQNLRLLTYSHVLQIEMDGNRAIGVRYRRTDNRECIVRARKEVILAAGAFGSPQLLLISGIGPGDQLRSFGIDVVKHLPAVGQNLHDHPDIVVRQKARKPVGLHKIISNRVLTAFIGAQWLMFRKGVGATSHFEVGAFIRSSAQASYPDLQLSFLALALAPGIVQGSKSIGTHGFQTHIDLLHPKSRGSLRLMSRDIRDPPEIQFNYLQHPDDLERLRLGLLAVRKIHGQVALSDFSDDEVTPGAVVQTDDEINDWIKREVNTAYHPVGTCRMGSPESSETVVDPSCRVIGALGLRVVDASIMPSIVAGNTNVATMMIAERASELIKAELQLAMN